MQQCWSNITTLDIWGDFHHSQYLRRKMASFTLYKTKCVSLQGDARDMKVAPVSVTDEKRCNESLVPEVKSCFYFLNRGIYF